MPPFLQNKFTRYAGIGFVIIVIVSFFLMIVLASLNDARSTGSSYTTQSMGGSMGMSAPMNQGVSYEMMESDSAYYPQPAPSDYTANLETYETTSYSVTARTKDFDPLCDTLTNLKADPQIHFKSLNESTNNCRARFFVEENRADIVLNTLTDFKGVEYTRNTSSVTRHRQQLQSQTDILQQQLARVESSLTAAQAQLDRLNALFHSSDDVTKLSSEVTNSLRYIDQLTQKKINFTTQLNNLYQQAADLEERMNVVQFDVSVYRSNPIYPNQESQKWENAWKQLKDTYTDTLIGLSAFFGIFLLSAIKYIVYLLVLIVIFRGLWKFVQLIWNRW